MKLVEVIADLLQAMRNCESPYQTDSESWYVAHERRLHAYVKNHMPSGSGFDAGTQILINQCNPGKIVFHTSFHHMNDAGFYDGWTEHDVIVTPTFNGVDVKITGPNKNDVKDYIGDIFDEALSKDVDPGLYVEESK